MSRELTVENFDLVAQDKNMSARQLEGWITPKTRETVAAPRMDFDALKKAAVRKDFKPVRSKRARETRHRTKASLHQLAQRRR